MTTRADTVLKMSLSDIRLAWYAAYFAGDIATLKHYEHPDFTYISAQGIETKASRYDTIASLMAQQAWFPLAAKREELTVTYHELATGFYVAGQARITHGNKQHQRYFSELWIQPQEHWQIVSLHATIIDESLL